MTVCFIVVPLFLLHYTVGGSCVYVHGRDANPIMTQCTVSNANNVGIFVDDHARVSLEKSLLVHKGL